MSADIVLALVLVFGCGIGVGWWRGMVYARKLIHFTVDLDEWADYEEATRQARGARRRQGRMTLFGTSDD